MQCESSTIAPIKQELVHKLPAGIMPGDASTELFGCRDTRKVFGMSRGKTIPFNEISASKRAQLLEQLLGDDVAMNDLKHLPQDQALEEYAFCLYGDADNNPDFCEEGTLKASDNFRCKAGECPCILWRSKQITVDGKPLTPKKVQIITLLAEDIPDKQIAERIGISQSTLDTHKAQIFELFGVFSTKGVIVKAIEQKIIQ